MIEIINLVNELEQEIEKLHYSRIISELRLPYNPYRHLVEIMLKLNLISTK